MIFRPRSGAALLGDRLRRAYEAALIAMLPAKVDGKPRHWPVPPPRIHALPALLLRPYARTTCRSRPT